MLKLITPLDQIDSTAQFTPGTRATTNDGNEYIYMKGVYSNVANGWVTYVSPTGSITLLATTGAKGQVGITVGALETNKFGWVCIKGYVAKALWGAGPASANVQIWASGTASYAGTYSVAGDLLAGAFSAGTPASGSMAVSLNYPFCTDTIS